MLCGTGSSSSSSDDASSGGGYFERQLSRFSTPEELLGPLSISALKVDQHSRCTEGYLLDPTLRVGFIDEILRGSTAILNTLLDLLAAPVDHSADVAALARQRGEGRPTVIAASHEVESFEVGSDLAPLLDRFILLVPMKPLLASRRRELLVDAADQTETAEDRMASSGRESVTAGDLAELAERAKAVAFPAEIGAVMLGLARVVERRASGAAARQPGASDLWKLAGVLKPRGHSAAGSQPEDLSLVREGESESEGSDEGGLGVISDRRLVRAARLLRFAAVGTQTICRCL